MFFLVSLFFLVVCSLSRNHIIACFLSQSFQAGKSQEMLHRLAVLSIQVGLAGCGSACGARWRSCCPQTGLGRSLVRTRPSSGGQAVLVREDRAVLGEGEGETVVMEKCRSRGGVRINSRQTDGRQTPWQTRAVAPQCKGLWLPLTSLSWKGGDGKGNN